MYLFGLSPAGKVKKAMRLVSEARALSVHDAVGARRKLEEGLALLRSIPEHVAGRGCAIAETVLALAQSERIANNNARAVRLFEEAVDIGVMLTDSDWDYLTVEMARAGRTDQKAMDACIAFAALRAREPESRPVGPVYELLEHCCRLDETTPPDELPTRLGLCSRIIGVDTRPGFPFYFRARHAFHTDNFAAALEDFKRAAERGYSPPDLGFFVRMCSGKQRLDEGALDQAAYYFVEAAKQNPNSFAANYEAGQCLVELCQNRLESGMEPEEVDASRRRYAIALLERACATQEHSAVAYLALGRAYYLDRRAEDAAGALRTAVALQPCAETMVEYARALRRTRAVDEAISAAREALRLDAGFLKARWLIASISMRRREFASAVREYRALAASLPAENNSCRNAIYGLGVCCFELGDTEDAINAFESLERQDLELNVEGALLLARGYMRRGDLDVAEARLAELACGEPPQADALYYLGCCRARQGRFQEAIQTLDAAERVGAEPSKTALQRGQVLEALGQTDDACRQYERAILGDSSIRSTASLRLAHLIRRMGRPAEALTYLEHAEGLTEVVLTRAELYAELCDREAADRSFKIALAAAPEDAGVRKRYGSALLRWGETARAEQLLQDSAEPGKCAPELIYDLGLSRLRAGDPEGALARWEQLEKTPERDARQCAVALYAARQARDAGDFECALAFWDRAIQAGADAATLSTDRSMCLVALALQAASSGDTREECARLLSRAVAINPEAPELAFVRAALQFSMDCTPQIEEHIESLYDQVPSDRRTSAEYLLGLIRLRQGDYNQAERLLRSATDGPIRAIARAATVPYAAALAATGRWDDAVCILAGHE